MQKNVCFGPDLPQNAGQMFGRSLGREPLAVLFTYRCIDRHAGQLHQVQRSARPPFF